MIILQETISINICDMTKTDRDMINIFCVAKPPFWIDIVNGKQDVSNINKIALFNGGDATLFARLGVSFYPDFNVGFFRVCVAFLLWLFICRCWSIEESKTSPISSMRSQ